MIVVHRDRRWGVEKGVDVADGLVRRVSLLVEEGRGVVLDVCREVGRNWRGADSEKVLDRSWAVTPGWSVVA
jgi:hypothetical protein